MWIYSSIHRLCFLSGITFLSLAIQLSAQSMEGLWEPLGPEGGHFLGAVVHPVDESKVTVFTSKPTYVYRTYDSGQSWEIIGSLGEENIKDFYIHDFETIYFLSSNNLYRSIDGGATWNPFSIPYQTLSPSLLCGLPSDPDFICAVSFYNGVTKGMDFFKSTDGGKHFTSLTHSFSDFIYLLDLIVAPSNPDVIYVSGYTFKDSMIIPALFQSTDGGSNWSDIVDDLPFEEREYFNAVQIDPVNENNVYVIGRYCYSSKDGGKSWNKSTQPMPASTVTFDPAIPGKIIAGANNGYYNSMDDGKQWTGAQSNALINGDCTYFAFSPGNPSTRYLCTSLSLYKSTDEGQTWETAQNGIYNSIVPAIGLSPSDPGIIYIEQENVDVLRTENGGGHWEATSHFAAGIYTSALLVHPTNPKIVFALEGYGSDAAEIYQSTNAGRVWNIIDSYLDSGFCLAQDPNDPNKIFAGGVNMTAGRQIPSLCISYDGGKTWPIRNTLPAKWCEITNIAGCRSIYITRQNSETVYACGSNGEDAAVFRSDNGGTDWYDMTNNLWEFQDPNVYDVSAETILCDPRNEETVYVGTTENLYVSFEGGSYWEVTGLNHPAKALVYDPVHEVLYAGTMDDGVYYSEDGLSWEPLGDALQNTSCLCLGINPENGTLYAGTDGRGTWRFTHSTGLPDWSLY